MMGRRFFGVLLGTLSLGAVTLPAHAWQAQAAAEAHGETRFAQAADFTFKAGKHATLPPHISTLLGLTHEEESPFMQGMVRVGSAVQGFSVSTKNKQDIVLFVVDESKNNQDLYLTSPDGTLRKVVSVRAGVGKRVMPITDKEKDAFETQKRFWVDRLAPVGTNR
jgi:hypothetical protein